MGGIDNVSGVSGVSGAGDMGGVTPAERAEAMNTLNGIVTTASSEIGQSSQRNLTSVVFTQVNVGNAGGVEFDPNGDTPGQEIPAGSSPPKLPPDIWQPVSKASAQTHVTDEANGVQQSYFQGIYALHQAQSEIAQALQNPVLTQQQFTTINDNLNEIKNYGYVMGANSDTNPFSSIPSNANVPKGDFTYASEWLINSSTQSLFHVASALPEMHLSNTSGGNGELLAQFGQLVNENWQNVFNSGITDITTETADLFPNGGDGDATTVNSKINTTMTAFNAKVEDTSATIAEINKALTSAKLTPQSFNAIKDELTQAMATSKSDPVDFTTILNQINAVMGAI